MGGNKAVQVARAAALNSKSIGTSNRKGAQEQAYPRIHTCENLWANILSQFLLYAIFQYESFTVFDT